MNESMPSVRKGNKEGDDPRRFTWERKRHMVSHQVDVIHTITTLCCTVVYGYSTKSLGQITESNKMSCLVHAYSQWTFPVTYLAHRMARLSKIHRCAVFLLPSVELSTLVQYQGTVQCDISPPRLPPEGTASEDLRRTAGMSCTPRMHAKLRFHLCCLRLSR